MLNKTVHFLRMGAILYGVCHSHSHGLPSAHVHSSANINVRAAAVHVLGDLLQSIGVLIAAVIIKFIPTAKMADPICTLIFSVIVVCTTLRVGRVSWSILTHRRANLYQKSVTVVL